MFSESFPIAFCTSTPAEMIFPSLIFKSFSNSWHVALHFTASETELQF